MVPKQYRASRYLRVRGAAILKAAMSMGGRLQSQNECTTIDTMRGSCWGFQKSFTTGHGWSSGKQVSKLDAFGREGRQIRDLHTMIVEGGGRTLGGSFKNGKQGC